MSYVVVLTSHLPHHCSAAFVFDDKEVADKFAAFLTTEVDPAQVLRASDPVKELLSWRQAVAERTTP